VLHDAQREAIRLLQLLELISASTLDLKPDTDRSNLSREPSILCDIWGSLGLQLPMAVLDPSC
jgi:hypothetical protein